ncbi:hypothetical protein HLV39_06195 [Marinobacter adhaerens]|uniref:Uncharacterized protein n=1 Tax=Marinobacter adhaerens TaxID=1033846 RepID=A0A851HUY5_9GAMM|nr:hypothetical protein [Marinobacter adhaerens]NWN91082.1 hypothetical protein [Marinobacter adhaerens]
MDIDDFMKSTNGPAYEKNESRNGPPLTYVGEKLRYALEHCHDLLQGIESYVPDSLPLPDEYQEGAPISAKQDLLKSPAWASFHYQVTAFVALFNMLGVVKSSKDIEHLGQMPEADFKKWLDFIEREGSVLG